MQSGPALFGPPAIFTNSDFNIELHNATVGKADYIESNVLVKTSAA